MSMFDGEDKRQHCHAFQRSRVRERIRHITPQTFTVVDGVVYAPRQQRRSVASDEAGKSRLAAR